MSVKKLLLTIFVFLFISYIQVQASTWVQIDEEIFVDKDSLNIYFDDYGIIKYDNRVTFWIKRLNNGTNFADSEKFYNKKILYIMRKLVFDFKTEAMASKSVAIYDADGNLIDSYTYKDFEMDWRSIVPDSNGANLYELVKNPKKLDEIYVLQQNENKKNN